MGPRCRAVCLFALAGSSLLQPQGSREFIFAANRSGIAEVIDAVTLETASRLHFDFQVERLSAAADGSRLHIAGHAEGAPCCKRYSLDVATSKLEEEVSSSYSGGYGDCLVSPDGRWCSQLKSFRGPALKMVDLREPASARELIPPGLPEENSEGNFAARGAWSGDRFYLYVARPNHPGFLWTVVPGAESLGAGVPVAPFGEAPGCRNRLPIDKALITAGRDVFLYEPFGSKADRTGMCGTALSGGAWMVDAATGRLGGPIASEFQFNALIADRPGSTLYGVVPASGNWNGPTKLVRLNARDGKVLTSRIFAPGVLQIAIGPLGAIPAGDVITRLPDGR